MSDQNQNSNRNMSDQNPNSTRKEIKKTVRLLNSIKNLATESSLTGSLTGAGPQAAAQFNAILRRMEQIGEVPEGFFLPLSPEASFDETGFAAVQLAVYLHEEEEEEQKHTPTINGPNNSPTIIMNGLNGLEGLEKIQDIGKIIREHLPEWMKSKYDLSENRTEVPEAPEPPAHPEPPTPSAPQPEPTVNYRQSLVEEAHTTNFVPDRSIGAEKTSTF